VGRFANEHEARVADQLEEGIVVGRRSGQRLDRISDRRDAVTR
jgi:hypothetical protein